MIVRILDGDYKNCLVDCYRLGLDLYFDSEITGKPIRLSNFAYELVKGD